MSTIDFATVASRLTTERLRSYTALTPELRDAVRLYDWNTAVSGALHEDLGRLEVVLRNTLDATLCRHGAERGWTKPWYRHEALFPGKAGRRPRAVIAEARNRATRGSRPEQHGKVVAELPFGFWRYLCRGWYLTSLWVPALSTAFPHHPSPDDARAVRETVEDRVQRLHYLRNRIAHHEPIHHRDLAGDNDQLQELTGWICSDTRGWLAGASRTGDVLKARP